MTNIRENNLLTLYTELNRYAQAGEFERAFKAANRILHTAPTEEKAFHCKIVCQIQLGKFEEALQAINKSNLSANLHFEKAYCQYRLNKPEDSLKTIMSAPEITPKLLELKAQVLYRLEQYLECLNAYRSIVKNTQDDYEDERETNLAAVIANLSYEKPNDEYPKLRKETYELCYNFACKLIGQGKLNDAERKLKVAEKLCRESLEEEPEDEVESEVTIIKVQLAYCLQMQGREKEAQAIYTSTIKNKPDDIALVAIAGNNSVCINRDQNIFDSKKKMKAAMGDPLEHKLTIRQRKRIAINNCLFNLYTNQSTSNLCDQLLKQYPDAESDVVLIKALEASRDKKISEAVEILEKYAKKNTKHDIVMKLTAVQLLLSQGERERACKILHNLGESSHQLGIISALVTLHVAMDNQKAASKVLSESVDWYRKNKSNSSHLVVLCKEAAEFHMREGQPEVAATSLEELLRTNPSSTKLIAQLVMAYAQINSKKAQEVSKRLPPLTSVTTSDVEALETSNWIMGIKAKNKLITTSKGESPPHTPRTDGSIKKPKQRKHRKGKLPKNYIEGASVDPERWLPKHERSGYRKKRDRRMKEVMKGSQGSANPHGDAYDFSSKSPAQNEPIWSPSESGGALKHIQKTKQQKKKKGGKR